MLLKRARVLLVLFFREIPTMDASNNATNSTDQTQSSLPMNIMFSFLEAALLVWICTGNILVIGAVARNRRLQTTSNAFIVSLAVADLMVGLLMSLHIAMFLKPEILDNIYACVLRYASLLVTMQASVVGLVLLTVERFCAIIYPLHYCLILTKDKVVIMLTSKWMYAFISGLLIPLLWHNDLNPPNHTGCIYLKLIPKEYLLFILLLQFIISLVVIVALYIKIFIVASRHGNEMRRSMKRNENEKNFRNNMKLTKAGVIVFGVFLFCWVPFVCLNLIQTLMPHIQVVDITTLSTLLAIANSGMNPIVYAVRLRSFLIEFKRMLRIRNDNQVEQTEPR